MTEKEQADAAKKFAAYWIDHGKENSDSQDFWKDLLHDVFGVERTTGFIKFEQYIGIHRMDAVIPRTGVLIEHKSFYKDLRHSKQKDMTAFQQARSYFYELDYSDRPRWIVTCNFLEFHIYDMFVFENKVLDDPEPDVVMLADFPYEYKRLKFLVDPDADDVKPEVINAKTAIEIVNKIFDAFKNNYKANKAGDCVDSLIKICIRLVFCYYAGDSKLFADIEFLDYIRNFKDDAARMSALWDIFAVLNVRKNLRDENLDETLKNLPYVNGGLFEENIKLPPVSRKYNSPIYSIFYKGDTEIKVKECKFTWRKINPSIFGAMFESSLDSKIRRAGGMHYTSIENIHKVIDPLFMNELYADFRRAKRKNKSPDEIIDRLFNFQDKLASLKFLDPACGSGNFLTETYTSLRDLENEVLLELRKNHVELPANPVKVSIHQFYGIEINKFAVATAQLALWIAENQTLQHTKIITAQVDLPDFPLDTIKNIHCANALQIDWGSVVDKSALTYIIGNPPFSGARIMDSDKKYDVQRVFNGWKNIGNLDYVCCWYKKATDFIKGTEIRCAFVSTNSITQGDGVATLWKPLMEISKIHIDFARRTFKWDQIGKQTGDVAAVHCVIIGFSHAKSTRKKFFYEGDGKDQIPVKRLNPYLIDAENIFVESRNKPLCDVPEMTIGNQPIDNGNYLFNIEELSKFLNDEPAAEKYIHPFVGADEFIKGKRRWCLWLGDCTDDELKRMPHCWERVKAVQQFRMQSTRKSTLDAADTPNHFGLGVIMRNNFMIVPRVSSENRRYIPIGFMPPEVIASDAVHIIPEATVYHFGVLISSVHMAWTRTVCGRLKSDYRYSKDIVYNNFPWCRPSPAQKAAICASAQNILSVRAAHAGKTLAWLYDTKTMPKDLQAAHQANDAAVMAAYGFDLKMTEAEVVAKLMEMYRQLVS